VRENVIVVALLGIGALAATQATWWSVLVLLACFAAVLVLVRRRLRRDREPS
jgi:membrane protein implicated in regulation of membrane protease activity